MRKYDAIVVGSGCAGLAAALELITAGKKTLLIEKHNLPGGVLQAFAEEDLSLNRLSMSCAAV